jgi:hypothetical protein
VLIGSDRCESASSVDVDDHAGIREVADICWSWVTGGRR